MLKPMSGTGKLISRCCLYLNRRPKLTHEH
jgi:hypothetical protein